MSIEPSGLQPSKFGLGQRLALFVGLVLVLGIGVVASVAISRQSAVLDAAFVEGAARSTDLVSKTLGGAVRFGKVENIVPGLAEFRHGQEDAVAWILIVNATGAEILVQSHLFAPDPRAAAAAATQAMTSGTSLSLPGITAAPIRFGPENGIVGAMIVGWSEETILAASSQAALAMAATGGALGLFFALIAYLVLSRIVSAPIARLSRSLTLLADDVLDRPEPALSRRDEIGLMAHNLEHLRVTLAGARAERTRAKEAAEAAVAAREAMLAALRNGVGTVVYAAQAGDFSRRVTQDFDDETLQGLATGVNAICTIIARFLDDGQKAITALSHGDLRRTMATDYTGRLGDFSASMNDTLRTLSTLVTQLLETKATISDTVSEIGRDSHDLSDRAIAQATALQQTSATMVELSTTIRTNADNARASSDVIGTARSQADTSRILIDRAGAAMTDIQTGAQQITEIVNAIDGFAFQTNLLALNAAVEAARAGDAGKGFAVVATEVRTLAQRAAEAAKDIRRLITVTQTSVDKGAEVVAATGSAMSGMLTSFVAIAPAMADISNATREQSLGVGELTQALTQIDDATQLNAHLAENGARRAQVLQEQALLLADLIGFFEQDRRASLAHAAE